MTEPAPTIIQLSEYRRLQAAQKHHNRLVYEDGICFRSLLEHRRYLDLKLQQHQGLITNLRVHTRYPLVVNGVKVGTYEDDFNYDDATGAHIVEDVKGQRLPLYVLKRNLMRACHGIEIIEVTA